MAEGFEVDKTPAGKIRINVVSVANFIAVAALLGAAVTTWTAITSRVDVMTARIEIMQREAVQIRTDLQQSMIARDGEQRELRGKVDQVGNRLTAVETILQRLERKLERP